MRRLFNIVIKYASKLLKHPEYILLVISLQVCKSAQFFH